MSWRRYYDFPYYPPAKPIAVDGGIKSKSKRGRFGESWWAKRWIATLESFNIGARLGRGRSYARKGQVTSIDIQKGEVRASVQGTRRKPYSVVIKVKSISSAEWKKVAGVFASQAIFAAKLLSGEMPEKIEDAFKQAGLSLFPEKLNDLATDCSCPDWSNPCKHIAAVYYLLGEEFDRDPFLIFKLRGITREELIELMGGTQPAAFSLPSDPLQDQIASLPPEPLKLDAHSFWGDDNLSDKPFGDVIIPSVAATLPKRLGGFPFWRGERGFIESLEPAYREASRRGLNVIIGEALDHTHRKG